MNTFRLDVLRCVALRYDVFRQGELHLKNKALQYKTVIEGRKGRQVEILFKTQKSKVKKQYIFLKSVVDVKNITFL